MMHWLRRGFYLLEKWLRLPGLYFLANFIRLSPTSMAYREQREIFEDEHRFSFDLPGLTPRHIYFTPVENTFAPIVDKQFGIFGPSAIPVNIDGSVAEPFMYLTSERTVTWLTKHTRFRALFALWRLQSHSRNKKQIPTLSGPPRISLISPWANHFGHFLSEQVPLLHSALQLGKIDEVEVLVQPDPPAWKTEIIKALGFYKISEYRPGTGQVTRVCSLPAEPPNKTNLAWLKECFVAEPSQAVDRIYVSRQKQVDRKIANEVEVERLLESHGFQKVFPEEITVSEQAQIFSKARAIFGCSGSGMMGMIFSQPGLAILEIFGSQIFHGLNAYIASTLNHTYEFVIAPSEKSSEFRREKISVPLEAVEEWILRLQT